LAKSKLWVAGYDLHYPFINKPTVAAMFDFLKRNRVDGFLFGGDQLDNQEISHHTKNKPFYRERRSYQKNTIGFDKEILRPLETLIRDAERVWIVGNHDFWEHELIEEQPELEGIIDRPESLKLAERGWEVIPLGHAKKLGKLSAIHGEILTGIGNQAGMYPSRKAVELYAGNVLAGHTHAPQSFTKVSPVQHSNKWQGHIAPILGDRNPAYLKNRPTSWLNGLTIIELQEGGYFNLYPVIVNNGTFSFGGDLYGNRK